ncbi:MAG: redox-sensing transcriptional repressor Rex [Chloroflexi bacterium]|nr:redox-sensing transcriptional repressor Rex [Chloroflexota bacterium]
MPQNSVPAIVIGRLPLYLRMLTFLELEGKTITASQELAERLGFSSAQIRKDLSYFGEFGKQGTGYNIAYLQKQLRQILKIDRTWEMALIGAGDLGHALANYRGFGAQNFRIAAAFDNAPEKIGARLGDLTVQSMDELPSVLHERKIQIAMLAVPADVAQAVAGQLVELGIRAVLNYAPITLSLPPKVKVYYIDPVVGLQSMTYYL